MTKKSFFYLVTILFILSGCSNFQTPFKNDPTHEAIPIIQEIFTPKAKEPIQLSYTVSIKDPSKRILHINLQIDGDLNDSTVLTFWTNAANWSSWYNPKDYVSNISILDDSGQSINYEWGEDGIDWTGEHGLNLVTKGKSHITLDYDVIIGIKDPDYENQFMGGYLNQDIGYGEPEFIFLAPVDIEHQDYAMTVHFDIPEDWHSVAHWKSIGENTYQVSTKITEGGYCSIEFANGAIAFGKSLLSYERNIGGTIVKVGTLGFSEQESNDLSEKIFGIYDYYTKMLGPTPEEGYIVILTPEKIDGYSINPQNENIGGFFSRTNNWDLWWINFTHPIFHNWTAYLYGDFWYGEGFTSYYELKSAKMLDIYDDEKIAQEFQSRWSRYNNEIFETDMDISLKQASDIYETSDHGDPYSFLTYKKGSMFALYLDQQIFQLSEGKFSLDDVMHYLWENDLHVDPDNLKLAIQKATGLDFTNQINDYLLGTKPMEFENFIIPE